MTKVLVISGAATDRRAAVAALGDLTNVVVQGAVADLGTARRAVADHPFDAIVTAFELADGDAIDVIELARRVPGSPQVIVFPGPGGEEGRRRCLDAGATAYVPRELGVRALVDAIASLDAVERDESRQDTFHLLGRMAAGVAHDLNNYLTVLRVSLGLVERRDADDLLWRHALEAIEGATRLNRCLLDYARGAAPEPCPVDLGALVRRSLRMVGRLMSSEIMVVVDDGGASLPPVRGVVPELEQLVLNLALNACDAMPAGGELRIRLRSPGRSAVVLEVMDTGGGLRSANAPSTKSAARGRGLGLGIVRSVVHRHRGILRVDERDGGGTVVTVVLAPWMGAPMA